MDKLRIHIKSQINIDETELDTIISNFTELKIAKDRFALKQAQLITEG